MHCTLKNYCLKYFYILSIFIFTITVDCANETVTTAAKKIPKNLFLKRMNKVDGLESFCKSFDTVLADVDVLFNGISNVNATHVKVLKVLEHVKKRIIFYTTALNIDIDNLKRKLKLLDYTTEFEVLNPINAFKWYLEKNSPDRKAYVIGDEKFKEMITSLDIDILDPPNTETYENYTAHYNEPLKDNVTAVIVGFDANINLYTITQALRYLNIPGVKLFLTQTKPILGSKYFDAWINKMREETHQPKQYIDRLNGVLGDYLVEKNELKDLKDKVLCITSNAYGSQNFTVANQFKPLLIGPIAVRKETGKQVTYYHIDKIRRMLNCDDDE